MIKLKSHSTLTMKKVFFTIIFLQSLNSFSQVDEKPQKISISPFSGQFLISTNLNAVYLNFVGAGIRYTKNNMSVAISLFPSLSFKEDKPTDEPKKPFVRPGFACGPLIQYKKLMLGFPTFYQDDRWHFTVGFGVRIGKI